MARNKLLILLTFVILFVHLSPCVTALNILAIVSVPLRSHYMAFKMLFRELATRGHSVTVINNFPDENPPPNLKFVNISKLGPNYTPPMSHFEAFEYAFFHKLLNFRRQFVLGIQKVSQDCENLVTNENVKEFRNKGEIFDVIFVEQFMSDCGLMFAAALYDAPIIGITSQTLLPWSYSRLGIPLDISSDACYFTDAGTNPSLYKKVQSYLLRLFMNTLGQFIMHQIIYKTFDEYRPNNQMNLHKIAREQMKMMFVYQHHSITGARLLPPSLHEIGGIHIQKPKPVNQDIENFISSAKYGVVYVSFGSNLKASTMSSNKLQHFLDAFEKIPQKILWKMENKTLVAGNDNILANDWFPQLDILCHPKVLAFVSHGGMLSFSEAAHCGKPLLSIPFFGDQFSNSAAVKESGLGTAMYFHELNADTLSETIKHLLSPKMQESAKSISKRWHDRPQHVMDSAIYWTEYVARHRNAPPALPSTRRTWFESTLLDVYSILLGILLATITLFYLVYRMVKLILVSLVMLLYSQYKLNISGKKKSA